MFILQYREHLPNTQLLLIKSTHPKQELSDVVTISNTTNYKGTQHKPGGEKSPN